MKSYWEVWQMYVCGCGRCVWHICEHVKARKESKVCCYVNVPFLWDSVSLNLELDWRPVRHPTALYFKCTWPGLAFEEGAGIRTQVLLTLVQQALSSTNLPLQPQSVPKLSKYIKTEKDRQQNPLIYHPTETALHLMPSKDYKNRKIKKPQVFSILFTVVLLWIDTMTKATHKK